MIFAEKIYENLNPDARRQQLERDCLYSEPSKILRKYDAQEKIELRSEVAELALKLVDLEEELKEATNPIRERMKNIKGSLVRIHENLRRDGEYVLGNVYYFDDQPHGVMYSYDENGNLLGKRSLTDEEKAQMKAV